MRNLRNIGHGVCRVPGCAPSQDPSDPSSAPALSVSASCWDVSRDEVIVATGPALDHARIELARLAKNIHQLSPSQL